MTELDLSAEEEDLVFTRGDTFVWSRTIKDSDGVAVDITGRTYEIAVDDEQRPADETGQLTVISGTVPTGTDGVVQFEITTANWAAIEAAITSYPATLFYDLEETTSGKVRTLRKGKFKVKQDINKP